LAAAGGLIPVERTDAYSATGRMSGERQQRWPVAAC
jgi:hypothetical protein